MKHRSLLPVLLACLALAQFSCAVPRMIWPQDDIKAFELNSSDLDKKVLVAARSSAFKDAVVGKIKDAFAGEPVYIKFIGIDGLSHEKASRYSAVIVINTCIAWGLDRHVEGFLGRESSYGKIVVLTTAGNANWMPNKKGRDYYAVTTASVKTDVDKVAGEVIAKVRAIMAAT